MQHDISLELLIVTPVSLFTKTQRTNISNRLLQVLTNRTIGESVITEALGLLVLCSETPSSSMVLFSKPDGSNEESEADPQGNPTLWLFGIASWLDEISFRTIPSLLTINLLKRLAVLVLK